uniref:Chromosome 3 open reading frame 49 n=1 Tax=Leptobrachium leishanense TaxID=445787 RepID=A0A8C5PTM8_9ANUR
MQKQLSGLLAYGPLNVRNRMDSARKAPRKKQNKHARQKAKGILRWHGAVSTDLLNQNVLVPTRQESTSESDSGSFIPLENKKKSFGQKVKSALGKVMAPRIHEFRNTKLPIVASARALPNTNSKDKAISLRSDLPCASRKPRRITKIMQHLPLSHERSKQGASGMPQAATLQLDVNVFEAEIEEITADNVTVRSRKTTRRMSVLSVPAGLQKVPYSPKKKQFAFTKRKKKSDNSIRHHSDYTVGNLQMQVDDLIETIAEKSTQLLAQRHEELRQCECLGDEIVQSSKLFQRVSKRSTRKYKFKNVCFPCICCC